MNEHVEVPMTTEETLNELRRIYENGSEDETVHGAESDNTNLIKISE